MNILLILHSSHKSNCTAILNKKLDPSLNAGSKNFKHSKNLPFSPSNKIIRFNFQANNEESIFFYSNFL